MCEGRTEWLTIFGILFRTIGSSQRYEKTAAYADTAATTHTRVRVRCRKPHTAPSSFAHPVHTPTQNRTFSSITLLAFQGMPFFYTPSLIDHSVRYAPGLFCQGSARSVPVPGYPPPPHESLESAGSHEIPRKIRRTKKLDIKIRETKHLGAVAAISIRWLRSAP